MILSDKDIRRALKRAPQLPGAFAHPVQPLVIDPLDESRIQPSSVDLTLDSEFLEMDYMNYWEPIDMNDVKKTDPTKSGELTYWPSENYPHETAYVLKPKEFVLASTTEYVEIPDDMAARVEGKSSLARLGLLVHVTAGYIDPGFKGKITLELFNFNERAFILRPGKAICQLSVIQLSSHAAKPYGHEDLNSKYQDQRTVTGSRYAG